MKKEKESYKVMPFMREFNHICPSDLEDILEYLEDNSYLSEAGKKFRGFFWSLFIKK